MGAQFRPATAAQVAAWQKRMGYSNSQAAAKLEVTLRQFYRWKSGDSQSPKYLGERFRTEGVK